MRLIYPKVIRGVIQLENIDVLGNAHLANFFNDVQNYEHLNNALKAYQQSVILIVTEGKIAKI